MKKGKSGQQPHYERVKQYVLSRVESGVLSNGSRVPSEHELVRALGVSRMTVNRALRELADKGLVVRHQGVGTFVATPRPRSSLIEIRNVADEIASRGHSHRIQLIELKSLGADAELAQTFGLRLDATLYKSVVVHYEDEVAIQLEERYVNPAFAPRYIRQDFTRQTTSAYLHTIASVTEVEHSVFAITPDVRIRKLLAIGAKESCLQMIRRTWVKGVHTSKGILTYPGTRFSLSSRFRVGE